MSSLRSNCECVLAGYCHRHAINKTAHFVSLCQTRRDYFQAWEEGRGPLQKGRKPPSPKARKKQLDRLRALWLEIHTYPLTVEVWDENKAAAWFKAWMRRIPNFGCKCKRHFRKHVKKHRPDFSSREAFFLWGVNAHNAVNEQLSKPILTLADAWLLYEKSERQSFENSRSLCRANL